MYNLDLEKTEEPRTNYQYPLDHRKRREFRKNIYLFFTDYIKAFVWITTNWKILRDGNTRPLTYLLRNLYAGQEDTVRTGHGTTDWFQIRKGVHQGCILSSCLFNLYAEYVMRNASLDEAQAGIKIVRRNINNFRYADDSTLIATSREELKSLLMKVKEEREKPGLKFSIQKPKIMTSCLITPWQIDGEAMETMRDFFGSKTTVDGDCSHEIKRHSLFGRMTTIQA